MRPELSQGCVKVDGTSFFNSNFAVEAILATGSQEVVADDGLGGRTSLGTADVDPLVLGVGIGYRF